MPRTTGLITVDPKGHSAAVTITPPAGAGASVYTTDRAVTAHTFPLTITQPTAFYVAGVGNYAVSGTIGGVESTGSSSSVFVGEGCEVNVGLGFDGVGDTSGGSVAPLQASAYIVGLPIAGGYQSCVDLVPGGTSQQNIVAGCMVPWVYPASQTFMLEVDAPAFTTGTLSIHYAEINVSNADGSQRIAIGLDTPLALTSGQQVAPIVFDDGAETTGAGSDLVFASGHAHTVAGGCYSVSFFLQFTVSADFG